MKTLIIDLKKKYYNTLKAEQNTLRENVEIAFKGNLIEKDKLDDFKQYLIDDIRILDEEGIRRKVDELIEGIESESFENFGSLEFFKKNIKRLLVKRNSIISHQLETANFKVLGYTEFHGIEQLDRYLR